MKNDLRSDLPEDFTNRGDFRHIALPPANLSRIRLLTPA
jgi:hypothetical protein